MTTSTSFSNIRYPIFKLNDDIVWSIFSFNADMDLPVYIKGNIPALLTLRNKSHVCCKWREIAIGASSLWARVLDLNYLSQKGDEWRKEVLSRTGQSPLHIRAVDQDGLPRLDRNSLKWILDENWTRIKTLEIRLNWASPPEDATRWGVFSRPAPALQFFTLSWPRGSKYFTDPNVVLFGKTAPSLRTLDVNDAGVKITALSLPNLRTLVYHSGISAYDLLSALSRIPFLEDLRVSQHSVRELAWPQARGTQPSLPHVTLPRLISIIFNGLYGMDTNLSILAHIKPAEGCALMFNCYHVGESTTPDILELYRHVISTYFQYSTELNTLKHLDVVLDNESCIFQLTFPSKCPFLFSIITRRNRISLPEIIISTIVDSFSGLRLDTITTLSLHLENSESLLSSPIFAQFILALVSVVDVDTNPETLNALSFLQSTTKVATFPALTNIYPSIITKLSDMTDFLDSRLEIGAANTFTVWMKPSVQIDLNPLEKYSGVTVRVSNRKELEI